MPDKPKVAFYWCASCGGCEEAVVDLAEDILTVVGAVDIILWPVAMDFKKSDIEARPDKSIVASFINGAVRTSEQEEWVRLLRKKSLVVVSFGACANSGGIPALANQSSKEAILKYVYEDSPSTDNPGKVRPQVECQDEGRTLTLPAFHSMVRALDEVIEVDYYLPGCPPTPKLIMAAVQALLSGKLPPKGTVLSPDIALCEECKRKDSKPADLALTEFKRPHQVQIDPEKCLLAQGIVCMGPATRGGCEALCPGGNMACTGCFGPTSRVKDQGAKFISSVFSNIVPKEVKEIDAVLDGIPDPIGTFYRYGLSKCLLRRKLQ
ncbi:MAG: oxidoreductase [Elusimicrobia bacterium GWC2_51_8]|nr:MAG: oxidoreductase [Elusimicrobia bacterium GWA2_51_34]OGR60726.1 MAG: oxidoreductase [Elusimicrobia bacterium GWC2_51_8]OGR86616.1 MAG: oxidoreductase [Elusimicrobia bacterium GWF2_52_66]HCE98466.1 oxidoreductase [Elusimicrobiota bacterium]